MNRRKLFKTYFGGALALSIGAVRAEGSADKRLGLLGSFAAPEPNAPGWAAWREGLRQAGFVEGRNLDIEYRWAHHKYDLLPGFAADLITRKVDAIFAAGGPAAIAARQAVQGIPVIFYVGIDPVGAGLVKSVNRPEANLTGVTAIADTLVEKRLQFLHELVPSASLIGFLMNPKNPVGTLHEKRVSAAAQQLNLGVTSLAASSAQ